MKKNIPEWNKDKVEEKGFDWFKSVYEGYVKNENLYGKYKKKTDAQLKSLFKEITGKEVKDPQSTNNKIKENEL